ncbi:MAG: hypothetical protein V3S12_05885 [Acidiferrobacterales bacterium]
MTMTITLTTFQIVTLAFDLIVVIVVGFSLRKLWELDLFKQGLIAHARATPVPPTAKLIKQWEQTYDELPDGSPKKVAYENRLLELGVLILDEDGNAVKAKQSSGD